MGGSTTEGCIQSWQPPTSLTLCLPAFGSTVGEDWVADTPWWSLGSGNRRGLFWSLQTTYDDLRSGRYRGKVPEPWWEILENLLWCHGKKPKRNLDLVWHIFLEIACWTGGDILGVEEFEEMWLVGKECIECESVFHNCYGGTFGSGNDQVEEVINFYMLQWYPWRREFTCQSCGDWYILNFSSLLLIVKWQRQNV